MKEWLRSPAGVNWRAAALLGLVTSTYSTLISQLLAGRIGRDAVVDWMVVAAIPLGDGMIQVEPGWGIILAGILFHQWADFSWEVFFFALLGRWTAHLRPHTLILLAGPWAVLTSALEWMVLVPALPFWQPIFTLNQPYWIGLFVHLTSASLYPLFPWVRDWMAGLQPSPYRRFGMAWSGSAVAIACVFGAAAFLGWQEREIRHFGRDAAFDQSYIRRMAMHHAQGVELGQLGVERAQDPTLRTLARLMVADQNGEIAVFGQWWRSWFGGLLPPASPEEHAAMPGMLSAEAMDALRRSDPAIFDGRFTETMTHHHQGAIAMADQAIHQASDIRLRLMAHATRHAQRGEIALMRNTTGFAATRAAIANMILPGGQAPPDGAP
jgi:uncharacterized protein (DUF305 family)